MNIRLPLATGCCALTIALSAACSRAPAPATDAATAVAEPKLQPATPEASAVFAEYWEDYLRLNPVEATFVGDPRYNAELPNLLGAEYRQQLHDFRVKWLARVRALEVDTLSAQDRLSATTLEESLQFALDGERFPDYLIPINQFYNLAATFAQLGSGTSAQPFATVADYDHWLARAGKLPTLFDQAITNMREGIDKGVVQPRVLMERSLDQLDALLPARIEDSLFYQPVVNLPATFSAEETARLKAAYLKLIGEQLNPAYARLRDFIRDEYLPKARDTDGMGALPDGADWYAYLVRGTTTTDMTPAQIHQIGLDEVARIHAEMRKTLDSLGFKGDLHAFFKFLQTDKQFEFASEQALLDAYKGLHARVEAAVPKLFSMTPKAGFEIRPVEAFRAKSAAGGSYQTPSEDGSRPGVFYVNTYDLPTRKRWDMEDLFLHEAIPGHHFQLAIQQELKGVPAFRRFGGETAFIEGWALYAESLGRDLGVYTDPYLYFGYLQAELWRAIRLVVDTGLHSKGWTREQVIDYMLANSAESRTQSVAEAERYMAIPSQALAYKMGELKIKALRQRAEAALGERFDIRGFHAEVLKDGAVRLDVLEHKIDAWIAAQPPAASASS